MDEQRQLIEQKLAQMRIICGALLGSFCLYAGLIVSGLLPSVSSPPDTDMIGYILAGVVVMELPLAVILRKLLYKARIDRSKPEELNAKIILEAYTTATIVAFAVWESSGILALVIYIVSGNTELALGLCAAGLLAMLLGWPRKEQIENELNKVASG